MVRMRRPGHCGLLADSFEEARKPMSVQESGRSLPSTPCLEEALSAIQKSMSVQESGRLLPSTPCLEEVLSAIQKPMSAQESGRSLPSTPCLEEALSAIHHALKDVLNCEDAPSCGHARATGSPRASPRAEAVETRLRPARQERSPEQPAARAAANGGPRLVGRLLQAPQQQPSRTFYVIGGFLFACVWTGVGAFIAWNYSDLRAMFGQGGPAAPQLFGLGAAVLVTSIILFALAHLVARVHGLTDAFVQRTGQLATKAEDINRALSSRATEIANGLDTRIACFEELLVGRVKTAASQLEVRASAIASALTNRADQLNQAVKAAVGEAERSIAALASSTAETIRASAQDAQRSLTLLASSTSEAIRTGANEAEQSLQALAASTTEAIRSSVQDAERTLLPLGISTAETISAGAQDAGRSLEALVSSTAEAFRVGTRDAEQSLHALAASAAEIIRDGTRDAEQALEVASRATAAVIRDGATDAEQALGTLSLSITNRIVAGTEDAQRRIAAMTASTADIIRSGADEIERRISIVASSIMEVLGSSSHAERALSAAAASASDSIRSIAQDAERILGTAALSASETIKSSVQGTVHASNAVLHELVRTTSEQERQRTMDALRILFEETTGEIQALFSQAAERFNQVVREMKASAAAVQRDLESTGDEMRRGLSDLPKDTAATMAQLRRVVVEQIEALAELNRIVARHDRITVEPMRPSVREKATAVSANATGQSPSMRFAINRLAQFSPPQPRPEGNGHGDWPNDVPAGASHEENASGAAERNNLAERSEEMTSLSLISIEIARMIDHDAVLEMWDQRRRGVRMVLNRRLYTVRGQQTFEEIRKKYHSNRDFKQTVDQYLSEFERAFDKDWHSERSYLASETGKIYTMLAHAAGRLDEQSKVRPFGAALLARRLWRLGRLILGSHPSRMVGGPNDNTTPVAPNAGRGRHACRPRPRFPTSVHN